MWICGVCVCLYRYLCAFLRGQFDERGTTSKRQRNGAVATTTTTTPKNTSHTNYVIYVVRKTICTKSFRRGFLLYFFTLCAAVAVVVFSHVDFVYTISINLLEIISLTERRCVCVCCPYSFTSNRNGQAYRTHEQS